MFSKNATSLSPFVVKGAGTRRSRLISHNSASRGCLPALSSQTCPPHHLTLSFLPPLHTVQLRTEHGRGRVRLLHPVASRNGVW